MGRSHQLKTTHAHVVQRMVAGLRNQFYGGSSPSMRTNVPVTQCTECHMKEETK